MMRWFLAAACVAGGVTMSMAESMTPLNQFIDQQIKQFEPPWRPTTAQLSGVEVVLEVRAQDGAAPSSGACHDLSRLTVEHLRHMIEDAGGTPRFVRPDRHTETVSATALAQRLADGEARAIVLVRYQSVDSATPVRLTTLAAGDAADRFRTRLQTLVAAADQTLVADSRPLPSLPTSADAVAVEVTFASAGCDPHWPEVLRHARWLFESLVASVPGELREQEAGDWSLGTAKRRGKRIWPFGDLPPERAQWFCDQFAQGGIRATSLIYFVPQAEVVDGQVVISGATAEPLLKEGLTHALVAVGVTNVDNRMRVLPEDAKLGDQRFGLCRQTTALTTTRPGGRGALQTDLRYGERVMLLDATETDYLVLAGDGYWGWCSRAAIATCDAARYDAALNGPTAILQSDIQHGELRIPSGARLPIHEASSGKFVLRAVDGALLTVTDDDAIRAPSIADKSVRAALDMLYTPYVFGGRTSLGYDCSGMVGYALRRAGVEPARDAWQQAMAGRLVATRWHRGAIQAGDLLYFINAEGHIHHTGMALSATHYIHASPPCVRINSLRPGDPLYRKMLDEQLFMVKRP